MPTEITKKYIDRFWTKVNKTNDCWNWTSTKNCYGYGVFCIGEKQWKVHRLSYFLLKKKLNDKLTIDHLCRNKLCVNPNHLEEVSTKINCQRKENTKVNKKDIFLIRTLYSKSIKQKYLASLFRVNQSEISRIINKERWGNINYSL